MAKFKKGINKKQQQTHLFTSVFRSIWQRSARTSEAREEDEGKSRAEPSRAESSADKKTQKQGGEKGRV